MSKKGESYVSKSDCRVLANKMHKVNEKIMEYAVEGFQKTGWSDGFMLLVALHDLKIKIDEVLKDESNSG